MYVYTGIWSQSGLNQHCLMLFPPSLHTAYAVPEGADHELLEPSARQQEDVHGEGGVALMKIKEDERNLRTLITDIILCLSRGHEKH